MVEFDLVHLEVTRQMHFHGRAPHRLGVIVSQHGRGKSLKFTLSDEYSTQPIPNDKSPLGR
jgi:hypothetical protein